MKRLPQANGLDALLVAGRRLLEVDPDAFERLLAAFRACVAAHDQPDEAFDSRLEQIEIRKRTPASVDRSNVIDFMEAVKAAAKARYAETL